MVQTRRCVCMAVILLDKWTCLRNHCKNTRTAFLGKRVICNNKTARTCDSSGGTGCMLPKLWRMELHNRSPAYEADELLLLYSTIIIMHPKRVSETSLRQNWCIICDATYSWFHIVIFFDVYIFLTYQVPILALIAETYVPSEGIEPTTRVTPTHVGKSYKATSELHMTTIQLGGTIIALISNPQPWPFLLATGLGITNTKNSSLKIFLFLLYVASRIIRKNITSRRFHFLKEVAFIGLL